MALNFNLYQCSKLCSTTVILLTILACQKIVDQHPAPAPYEYITFININHEGEIEGELSRVLPAYGEFLPDDFLINGATALIINHTTLDSVLILISESVVSGHLPQTKPGDHFSASFFVNNSLVSESRQVVMSPSVMVDGIQVIRGNFNPEILEDTLLKVNMIIHKPVGEFDVILELADFQGFNFISTQAEDNINCAKFSNFSIHIPYKCFSTQDFFLEFYIHLENDTIVDFQRPLKFTLMHRTPNLHYLSAHNASNVQTWIDAIFLEPASFENNFLKGIGFMSTTHTTKMEILIK